MLNISSNKTNPTFDKSKYKLLEFDINQKKTPLFIRIMGISLLLFLIICFLPWTQTIETKGAVSTLHPDQRPQTIQSIIAGRIENWYVKEGDFVNKGDTIVFISETKQDYFDPNLIQRTQEQIGLKEKSIDSYGNKLKALQRQLQAYENLRLLKLEQTKNKLKQAKLKVKSDSIDFIAFEAQYIIAERQFKRTDELYKKGLKSLKEVEQANLKMQESMAKTIAQENKLLIARNEVVNCTIEINNIQNEYMEKQSKLESDQFSIVSDRLEASTAKVKLENQYSNYIVRRGYYFITAPTSGYLTKLFRTGVGVTVKEGEPLISFMPQKYKLALEMYIDPVDYPLIQKGTHVRVLFDGWPSIVFKGWPNSSYGTFGGNIIAIDNFTSSNGKYRVLVVPDNSKHKWPKELRVGSGAKGYALLKDVPIWYELWRNLNGFPPEYYKDNNLSKEEQKKK